MARDIIAPFKIALLATGDEICQGDIVNTNSQEIAQRFFHAGMEPWLHVIAPDIISEIEASIRFLLNSHQALIITGGLGPTSDDLTRFALGKVIGKELVFDEATWQAICKRLQNFGYTVPPTSNRQQALFPAGAIIIPNKNGTAAGCSIKLGNQYIFMLPGPPMECLPMVDQIVLPMLKEAGFEQVSYHKKWLLFGASEGKIAEELDELAKPFACVTGYRLSYPYIEFKLHANQSADFQALTALVEKTIQPYLLGDGQQPASIILQKKLAETKTVLQISDHATGGALQQAVLTPQNYAHLRFTDEINANLPHVFIEGLAEFWEAKPDTTLTSLKLRFPHEEINVDIPFRGKRVIQYAVEILAHYIDEYLDHGIKDATT
ncbi:MAG: molybdopterin-binding protein [Pseudomonadota bacterium]